MSEILVVGAGVAGMTAGRALAAAGHRTVLVDKGLRPGGRLATRTVGSARFDHGAQFFTTKDPRFERQVATWRAEGVARTWFHGSPDRDAPPDPDGYPRYRAKPTMRRLAEHLASGLTLHLGTVVERIAAADGRWVVTTRTRGGEAGPRLAADAVVLTAPVPQAVAMLDAGSVVLEPEVRRILEGVVYDPCIAVLAVPERTPALPARGAIRLPTGPIGWLTDNQVTGASPTPAVTIHATAGHSRQRFDDPDDEVGRELAELARDQLGTGSDPVWVHRWRYSSPVGRTPADALLDRASGPPLVVAGDAMTGGRVEGAALSGSAAAERLVAVLPRPT